MFKFKRAGWAVLGSSAALVASVIFFSTAQAEGYPDRPITLVAPYGPGGASDLSARMIAGAAPAHLGQPVLAVNKTGAAGVVGSNFVLNSKPDGYTCLLYTSPSPRDKRQSRMPSSA